MKIMSPGTRLLISSPQSLLLWQTVIGICLSKQQGALEDFLQRHDLMEHRGAEEEMLLLDGGRKEQVANPAKDPGSGYGVLDSHCPPGGRLGMQHSPT